MVELDNLRVSLTKNGYLKIAKVVSSHGSTEMLEHVRGSHPGVNLERSQVSNVLCADPFTGMVPAFWDEVRRHDQATIEAFTFIAIVFSHERLIHAFVEGGDGAARGTLFRADMSEKEFTNLQFAMATVGLCDYRRGADQVTYDMTGLFAKLRSVGGLVGQLLRAKPVGAVARSRSSQPRARSAPGQAVRPGTVPQGTWRDRPTVYPLDQRAADAAKVGQIATRTSRRR